MKVSIVIPVYNEASQLGACLRSIAAQNVRPHEVIVVDNNSSDLSVKVAGGYDFVTVIREPKQGVLHARTTGFNASSGDIIARIDADSLLPEDWVASIIEVFATSDVQAVSGVAEYYDVAGADFFNSVDLFFRRRLSRQLGERVFLWGANMAIRRDAWTTVRDHLCAQAGIHEDFDIAIHLQELGGQVTFDERLKAGVSSRRIDTRYMDFMRYMMVSPKTYAMHGIRQRWHMYTPMTLCAVAYFPLRLLHRGYDVEKQSFNLIKVLESSASVRRVDPTANIV